MDNVIIRPAERRELDQLCELERRCFDTDRLSRRNFSHLLRSEHADLLIALQEEVLVAYALILYRSGTNLARLYSIAVAPEYRGQKVAQGLLEAAEQQARSKDSAFMRLEVNVENEGAIHLYERSGYHRFCRVHAYYKDGSDAWRMEKTIRRRAQHAYPRTEYYEQTTPFTCGPASLMMAMNRLDPQRTMNRTEELRIWRESTTVYMTSGHGGCSPHGLALSAWHRGFDVTLYVTPADTPFIDSVRDPEKKSVIELVHQDYLTQLQDTDVQLISAELDLARLISALEEGAVAVALISTWRLNRNKAPHWVLIGAIDDRHVYISDPDFDRDPWQSETDYIDVPVGIEEFRAMARFGRSRLCATLLLKAK